MEIVVLGYAGESGSRRIFTCEPFREKLLSRYPERFFRCLSEPIAGEDSSTTAFLKEIGIPEDDYCEADDGGVFAALWRVLKKRHMGASFSQRAIPIRQQTVEICEYFDLDPFRLQAEDCFICLLEESAGFCGRAEKAGLSAAVIGYTEAGCAVKRIDGEETAYLRRPEEDALLRLLREKGGAGGYDR